MTKHALNSGFFALLRRILLERTRLPDRRGEIGKQKYSALLLQTSVTFFPATHLFSFPLLSWVGSEEKAAWVWVRNKTTSPISLMMFGFGDWDERCYTRSYYCSYFSLSSPLLLPHEKMTAEILTLNKKEHIQLFGSAEKPEEQKVQRVVRDGINHTAYDAV